MKRTTRLLAGTLMTLALTAGIPMTMATTANAAQIDILLNGADAWVPVAPLPGAPTAYPGMFIDFAGDMGKNADNVSYASKYCTMGVVGTDSAGRKIGITAGHCAMPASYKAGTTVDVDPGPATAIRAIKYDGPARGAVHAANDYPVYDRSTVKYAHDNPGAGLTVNPIGWVRWVDADVCDWVAGLPAAEQELDGTLQPCAEDPAARETDLSSLTDYMVIEFAPEVQLSSQVLNKNLSPVMSLAGGGRPFKVNSINTNSSGAPALPAVLFNDVELYGARTDRMPTALVPVSPSSGIVTNVNNGIIRAAAGFEGGDSGGPVVLLGTGKWVGIVTATLSGIPPWVNTSAKNILGDLNPRGIVGSGFTPVNN